MNLKDLLEDVRDLTRDVTGSLFPQETVINFLNEGIDRLRSIPALENMSNVKNLNEEITYLPTQYQHLISLYGASRCFFQDEQLQQADMLMREFEFKTTELNEKINNGSVKIVPIVDGSLGFPIDYVKDVYFNS